MQPYVNFSYVSSPNVDPATILQFDRVQPSTNLNPIDFPQYTPIDALDQWTIARVGVRNRLQTRRDDLTVSWLEVETFVDVNFNSPFDTHKILERLQSTAIYSRALGDAGRRLAGSVVRPGLQRGGHED